MKREPPSLARRASGVLLHPTSLPGPGEWGDLGPEAFRFADFLAEAGQRWWQMLPIGPVGAADSPYLSSSSFAGDPRLVSLEALARDGLLPRAQRSGSREAWLRYAFERFRSRPRALSELAAFRNRCRHWLPDYALFEALRNAYRGATWTAWQAPLRDRHPRALARARRALATEIRFHEFVQYAFERQWAALRAHCADRGIGLIGDVPIFVSHDSADVWAHPEIFRLDARGRPQVVAGVPPDYFSRTGQLWGNPLYRWEVLRRRGYDWWLARLRAAFARFDAVRLDHFIGFHRYWEVPAGARTAVHGRWRPGPGAPFFEAVFRSLGRVQLIAEDLGRITPEVEALRDRFGLPGMRVLQFAFGSDPGSERYRPHRYPRNCVVYTGTHDNDTLVGWFRGASAPHVARERAFALRYAASDGREVHWDFIRLAWSSVANTAIVPAQDLLGLGSEARMNTPGVPTGNWRWRLRPRQLGPPIARRLRELTETYGRLDL